MTCLRGYVTGLYVDESNRYLMVFIPRLKDRDKNKNFAPFPTEPGQSY